MRKTVLVQAICTLFASAAMTNAAPLGAAFTYQGALKQSGQPVNASADMQFKLFNAATGGAQVGSTLTFDGAGGNPAPIAVAGGVFTVGLDFGVSSFNGEARWLEVTVRVPAGVGAYTPLTPRQPLTGAPYALQTRGLFTDTNLNVGIGTTTPTAKLNVSSGDLVIDRGTAVSTVTRSLILGGARDINSADFALIDFRNYDLADSAVDYVGARIASRNDGSDDGDLRFSVAADGVLSQRMLINSLGNVGIGTSSPSAKLEVSGSTKVTALEATDEIVLPSGTIRRGGASPATNDLGLYSLTEGAWMRLVTHNAPVQFFTNRTEGIAANPTPDSAAMTIHASGNVGIGIGTPSAKLQVSGRIKCRELEIDAGADIVEGFASSGPAMLPGTVVVIDPENPGAVMASNVPYDARVAGVVSGAKGVPHGLKLGTRDLDGDTSLALVGRVHVRCSTENGPIVPGDRLTTASVPGHAMRVTDAARADGAVIGKAMTGLKSGEGLVLVLVNLQ